MSSLLYLVALAWLWWRLLAHLQIEWSLNPQYAYGYAVPFLSAWMIYRRVHVLKARALTMTITGVATLRPETSVIDSGIGIARFAQVWPLTWFSLGVYGAVRLAQEANPDWRLLSWALAVVVLSLTFVLLPRAWPMGSRLMRGLRAANWLKLGRGVGLTRGRGRPLPYGAADRLKPGLQAANWSKQGLRARSWVFVLLFPLAFFLVAVPWPSALEQPLVRALALADTRAAAALLNLLGTPALCHGNVLELPSGFVSVDAPCSGIRSLQACLMLALFFGEVFQLCASRRWLCVAAGLTFSLTFNLVRTALLAQAAAARGIAFMMRWHDPAGVAILVACFLCLWRLARVLKPVETWRGVLGSADMGREKPPEGGTSSEGGLVAKPAKAGTPCKGGTANKSACAAQPAKAGTPCEGGLVIQPAEAGTTSEGTPNSGRFFALAICSWLALSDVASALWYRAHESRSAPPVTWTFSPPDGPTLRLAPLSDHARQLLRFDEARSFTWQPNSRCRWQAIYLRWKPGRAAAHLAQAHTPESCVTAGGRPLVRRSDLVEIPVGGLRLPFKSYVFDDPAGPLRVWYCLWQERSPRARFESSFPSLSTRLGAVLAGRRNQGECSLELALWGVENDEEADALFRGLLLESVTVTEGGQRSPQTER